MNNKERYITFFVLVLITFCILLSGCVPGTSSNETVQDPDLNQEDAQVDAIINKVVEKEVQKDNVPVVNETNETVVEEIIPSGSLDLQKDLSKCPHIKTEFSCDKYDPRRCGFKTTLGQNDYYPDLLNCRAGSPNKGEDPNDRYCIIQECGPVVKKGVVQYYGGPIIFARFDYREEKVTGGIMTHYSLVSCGEDSVEFETEYKCTVYKAELDELWVNEPSQ